MPDPEQTTQQDETTERPWWQGPVCTTGRLRVKVDLDGDYRLQELVLHPTGGGRGRWINLPMVDAGASDDE